MARKKKKKEEPSGPAGAPEWVVTFTDMISLLVTFFVLLMTFSSIRDHELMKIDDWFKGGKGVFDQRSDVNYESPRDDHIAATDILRGSRNPHSRPPQELPDSIAEMGQKQTDRHRELDLNEVRDGLIIEFTDEESFGPGSAHVNDELHESLGEVARVLQHYPHLVVVEGLTSAGFQPTPAYATPESLSFARAQAAARVMLQESGLPAERLQVSALGARHSRADDASARGRRVNERVRLRVLSLSKLRASYLEHRDADEENG